ncbi:MAG: glycosyltransferase family 2 protein [Candidatus Woesearchaeota archaeon]
MLNILIPLGGKSQFFNDEDYPFPKPVIEIDGKPMIQLVLDNFLNIKRDKRFIFILREEDCTKYHIDKILKLLTEENCVIVKLSNDTKGAACSALMAIDNINNDDSLIISNGDQILDIDFNTVLNEFEDRELDGGLICFESVHPKWSYARLDENGKIIETAEKKPISKNAIAGFYYYAKGKHFVNAAMRMIENDASVGGIFFVAPTFNELVLAGKNLEIIKIPSSAYHSFYSPQKIVEYEKFLGLQK